MVKQEILFVCDYNVLYSTKGLLDLLKVGNWQGLVWIQQLWSEFSLVKQPKEYFFCSCPYYPIVKHGGRLQSYSDDWQLIKFLWIYKFHGSGTWVGSLVEHVKYNHRDRNSRQIRTQCPHEECGRMGVDIKNHIRMVQDKVRNYSCEECHPTFSSSYQSVKHALSRMCQKMQNGNLMIEAHKNSS